MVEVVQAEALVTTKKQINKFIILNTPRAVNFDSLFCFWLVYFVIFGRN